MQSVEALKQLGLSENEVKIYLVALELGETTLAELAKKVGLPRTTVREEANSMRTRGLLENYVKHGHTYWVGCPPHKLITQEQKKEEALNLVLPELEKISAHSRTSKPTIRIYNGAAEIKLILDDIIESKYPILALVNWPDVRLCLGDDFMDAFVERRIKHFLKINLITPHSPSSIILKQKDASSLRHTRFLPEKFELRRISNFIYGDKTAIISMNRKEPLGIVLQDPDVVHAMTVYFESLWSQSAD